ncbi:hypothetical protein GE118_03630 [Mycoplasma sp. NEAQ87857]|uniref:hypothetical protein n=1 Tax=Mycoplasma sp. NEAQ87857 TaxID=2683967 RepID=UPI00131734B3|nr:hypothetical protein [Mycoplasma sp. NEAQ87857]QGZ97873.1 hypothetical protein GE118_03630 [Mycoplasma sp. NEAQ87857]
MKKKWKIILPIAIVAPIVITTTGVAIGCSNKKDNELKTKPIENLNNNTSNTSLSIVLDKQEELKNYFINEVLKDNSIRLSNKLAEEVRKGNNTFNPLEDLLIIPNEMIDFSFPTDKKLDLSNVDDLNNKLKVRIVSDLYTPNGLRNKNITLEVEKDDIKVKIPLPLEAENIQKIDFIQAAKSGEINNIWYDRSCDYLNTYETKPLHMGNNPITAYVNRFSNYKDLKNRANYRIPDFLINLKGYLEYYGQFIFDVRNKEEKISLKEPNKIKTIDENTLLNPVRIKINEYKVPTAETTLQELINTLEAFDKYLEFSYDGNMSAWRFNDLWNAFSQEEKYEKMLSVYKVWYFLNFYSKFNGKELFEEFAEFSNSIPKVLDWQSNDVMYFALSNRWFNNINFSLVSKIKDGAIKKIMQKAWYVINNDNSKELNGLNPKLQFIKMTKKLDGNARNFNFSDIKDYYEKGDHSNWWWLVLDNRLFVDTEFGFDNHPDENNHIEKTHSNDYVKRLNEINKNIAWLLEKEKEFNDLNVSLNVDLEIKAEDYLKLVDDELRNIINELFNNGVLMNLDKIGPFDWPKYNDSNYDTKIIEHNNEEYKHIFLYAAKKYLNNKDKKDVIFKENLLFNFGLQWEEWAVAKSLINIKNYWIKNGYYKQNPNPKQITNSFMRNFIKNFEKLDDVLNDYLYILKNLLLKVSDDEDRKYYISKFEKLSSYDYNEIPDHYSDFDFRWWSDKTTNVERQELIKEFEIYNDDSIEKVDITRDKLDKMIEILFKEKYKDFNEEILIKEFQKGSFNNVKKYKEKFDWLCAFITTIKQYENDYNTYSVPKILWDIFLKDYIGISDEGTE